jgi:mRNA interferase HigB
MMRPISKHPRLSDFWTEHPDAERPLLAWRRLAEQSNWQNLADVRRDYPHADQVGRFVVFNIGGNKYRLATVISFPKGKIYVHRVMTHKEYDRGEWKNE